MGVLMSVFPVQNMVAVVEALVIFAAYILNILILEY